MALNKPHVRGMRTLLSSCKIVGLKLGKLVPLFLLRGSKGICSYANYMLMISFLVLVEDIDDVGRMTKSRRGKLYIDDAGWGPEAGSIK